MDLDLKDLYELRWKDLVFADAKAIGVAAAAAALLTGAYIAFHDKREVITHWPFIVGVVMAVFSLAFAAYALYPRLRVTGDSPKLTILSGPRRFFGKIWKYRSLKKLFSSDDSHRQGVLFYHGIVKTKDATRYLWAYQSSSPKSMDKELASEIRRLAIICYRKYQLIRWSVLFLVLEGVAFFITLLSVLLNPDFSSP